MKKLITLLSIILVITLTSCKSPKENQYIVEITYNNGDKDTISIFAEKYQDLHLQKGDIWSGNEWPIASNVRYYNIINIYTIKDQ